MNTIKTIAVAAAVHGLLAGGAAEAKSHTSSGDKDAQIELLTRRLEQLEKRLEQSEAKAQAPKAPAVAEVDKQTLKQVDQKVKLLERKLEVDKEESKAKWASFPKNVELGIQGLKVVSQDENFIMYMRALIQADGRFFVDDTSGGDAGNTNGDSLPDQFTLRRVRPILEGTVWKWFDYRIMPDFAGGTTRLFDAYADLRYFREASLTAGKFKAPVSLERLQSASALTFTERAFPTQLAPNRDVGFMLHGEFDKPGYPSDFSKLERNQTHAGNFPLYMYPEFFSYQVGVFDGSRNNGNIDSDSNDSKEFQGRIFAHPFLHSGIEPLEGLGLGVAGTWGQPNSDKLSNYQSPGLNNIFTYASAARGDGVQYRVYPQGYWIWGPFQLLGEYALSSQDLANQATVNGFNVNKAETNTTDQAWNVTVSYLLTGEENVFLRQGIKPRHPFDPMYGIRPNQPFNPAEGHWGAFQVAARWSYIDFDNGVFENIGSESSPKYAFADPRSSVSAATTWALGANWWLNPNVKLMADYSQTSYDGGAGFTGANGKLGTGVRDLETEKVFSTRVQLAF
jgi:phosphate-selective porin OprO/OprP